MILPMNAGVMADVNSENQVFGQFASRERVDFVKYRYYLPNPDPVLKANGNDISVYRELSYDAHVGACIAQLKDGVKELEWRIVQGKAPGPLVDIIQRVFDYINDNDETGGLPRIIGEILDARMFGFQPMEITYKRFGNFVLPIDLVGKPQEWFEFDNLNNLKFKAYDKQEAVAVPVMKFICPTYEGSYNNPYGHAVLSSVFWDVIFKKGGLKFFVTFAEKYGMPWAVGKHNYTDDAKVDKFRDELDNMVADGVAVLPVDTELTLESGADKGADVYTGLIALCKENITQAILSHTGAAISTAGRLGNDTMAETVRSGVINSSKTLVAQACNVLIARTCELNRWTGPRPKFQFFEENEVNTERAERDKTLSEQGVKFRKAYYVKAHDLAEDDFDMVDVPAPVADGAAFAAGADQAQIDALEPIVDAMPQRKMIEGMVNPVLDAAAGATSFEEYRKQLAGVFDDMEGTEFEKNLAALTFAANATGRLYAEED